VSQSRKDTQIRFVNQDVHAVRPAQPRPWSTWRPLPSLIPNLDTTSCTHLSIPLVAPEHLAGTQLRQGLSSVLRNRTFLTRTPDFVDAAREAPTSSRAVAPLVLLDDVPLAHRLLWYCHPIERLALPTCLIFFPNGVSLQQEQEADRPSASNSKAYFCRRLRYYK
jgi:hypothetical protein